jgi:ABC-type antimicrobial peptide transport system permease subunit
LQTGIGLAIGIPMAIGAGKLMTNQLFGVKPWDPVMLALAALMLGTAALLATALPARRAAGVEPMTALRNE